MSSIDGEFVSEYLERVRSLIDERGWMTQCVVDDPPYAYTVGLHGGGRPELLIIGMPPESATQFLNLIAHEYPDLAPGDLIEGVANVAFRAVGVPTHRLRGRVNVAKAFYGELPSVLQIQWPCVEGFFPGQDGYTAFRSQPDLSESDG